MVEAETKAYKNQERHQGFANTVKFAEEAVGDDGYEKAPERLSIEQWQENLDMTLTYLLSPPDNTLKHTGLIFNKGTRAGASYTKNKTMLDLWENALDPLQSRFPWEELERNLKKPKGILKEIKVRPVAKTKELSEQLRRAKTRKEKRRVFKKITKSIYTDLLKEDDPVIITIKSLLEAGRFHLPNKKVFPLFTKTLESAKIPMGSLRYIIKGRIFSYHFICSSDRDPALNVLLQNENLQQFLRNPVQQILGPKQEKVPSTTNLMHTYLKHTLNRATAQQLNWQRR